MRSVKCGLRMVALGAAAVVGHASTPVVGAEPQAGFGRASFGVVNVRDYGAVGDDQTDDTAALQAAVDATGGPGHGLNGGRIYVPEGTYVLSDTILFRQKSVVFEGAGWGNPKGFAPNPGRGTVIRWADGAGRKPMFEVQDCQGLVFRDFRLQGNGNEADIPLAGIRFHHNGAIGHGNNSHLIMENVFIGRYVWTGQGLRQGDVEYGVLVDGKNGNNDQMYFNAVRVVGARTAGIALMNSQSVWSQFSNCMMGSCGTGFHANCSTMLQNAQFDDNALDLHAPGTGLINVIGYNSENAKMLLKMGPYAKVFIEGGYSQLREIDNEHALMIDGTGSHAGQTLSLRNHSFTQAGDPPPKIRIQADSYIKSPSTLVVEDCPGLVPEMLDLIVKDPRDRIHVYWRSAGRFFRQCLSPDNPRVDPGRWEMDTDLVLRQTLRHEGPSVGFFGAQPRPRPVVTGSWIDGSATRSLAKALSELGLIEDRTDAE